MKETIGITGQFELHDFDLRYQCTATWAVRQGEVVPIDLNIIGIQHSGYELPADEGFDPEPLIFDIRHVYQQIDFEKRLRDDFADDILEQCRMAAQVEANP